MAAYVADIATSEEATTVTTHDVQLPNDIVSGDIIFCFVMLDGNVSWQAAPSGWNKGPELSGGTTGHGTMYWTFATDSSLPGCVEVFRVADSVMSVIKQVKRSLSYEGIVRLIADAILINLAILASLAARFFSLIVLTPPQTSINDKYTFWHYLYAFGSGAWLLTLVCLVVFTLNGFYTYGRYYRGLYKALVVVQAVSVAYLICGFLYYSFEGLVDLPRGTFAASWILAIVFLVGARLWASVWGNVTSAERSIRDRPQERKIRTVLVIGGAGYIGSALLPKLLDKGYRVHLLDFVLRF